MGDRVKDGPLGRSARLVATLVLSIAVFAAAGRGFTAENSAVGTGNGLAIDTSDRSALVLSAKRYILARASEIRDGNLRTATLDAIDNPQTCSRHRLGLDDAAKTRIMANLSAEGLVDPEDEAKFPGGLMAGVFQIG